MPKNFQVALLSRLCRRIIKLTIEMARIRKEFFRNGRTFGGILTFPVFLVFVATVLELAVTFARIHFANNHEFEPVREIMIS
jgi:hypothetical protein